MNNTPMNNTPMNNTPMNNTPMNNLSRAFLVNHYGHALADALGGFTGEPISSQLEFYEELAEVFSEEHPDIPVEGGNGPMGQIRRMVYEVYGQSPEQTPAVHGFELRGALKCIVDGFLEDERRRTYPAELFYARFSVDGPALECHVIYKTQDGVILARRLAGTIDPAYDLN